MSAVPMRRLLLLIVASAAVGGCGYSQLDLAILRKDVPEAKRLIAAKSDLNTYDFGYAPIHYAAFLGQHEVVAGLLGAGVNPDEPSPVEHFTPLIEAGGSYASSDAQVHTMEALLAAHARVDAATDNGTTPLMLASAIGRVDAVRTLLDHGASVHLKLKGSVTEAIHLAAYAGHDRIVSLLLKGGAKPDADSKDQNTPLILAARNGHIKVVALLLEAGANANAAGTAGATALINASARAHPDIVTALLAAGAAVNQADAARRTPLLYAAAQGGVPLIETLVNAGADIDFSGPDGPALFLAARGDHVQAVAWFAQRGARPFTSDKDLEGYYAGALCEKAYGDVALQKGAPAEAARHFTEAQARAKAVAPRFSAAADGYRGQAAAARVGQAIAAALVSSMMNYSYQMNNYTSYRSNAQATALRSAHNINQYYNNYDAAMRAYRAPPPLDSPYNMNNADLGVGDREDIMAAYCDARAKRALELADEAGKSLAASQRSRTPPGP